MPLVLGGIVMWSGLIAEIPEGWQLCDGTNGTPDLRNKFIIGAGNTYAVGNTGGSADAIIPIHSHTGTTNSAGNHSHLFSGEASGSGSVIQLSTGGSSYGNVVTNSAGDHTHTLTINSAGESGTNKNLPPYYALAFIQQVQ